jgi:hypothetical protein
VNAAGATEFFDPTVFAGDVIPRPLREFTGLAPGPKLLYGRLASLARVGKGEVYPSQETLAAELGTNVRQVRRWTEELESQGFVVYIRPTGMMRVRHMNGTYRFLAHPIFDPTRKPPGVSENGTPHDAPAASREVPDDLSGAERTDRPAQEGTDRPVLVAKECVAVGPTPSSAGADVPDQHGELVLLDSTPTDPTADVWTAYEHTRRSVLGDRYRHADLTPVRRRLIDARLRTHGLAAVLAAVQGWRHDAWVRGENPSRKLYATLEFVLRVSSAGDHVERFATMEAEAADGTLPAETPTESAALDVWAAIARGEHVPADQRRIGAGGGA